MKPPDLQRIVAIDWSGDRSPAGQRRKIWAGIWTAHPAGRSYDGHIALENNRTRAELIPWLIDLAAQSPRMVVAVDFCFSYPAWFVQEHRAATAPDFWHIVTRHAESWLDPACADARFWGRIGANRTGKKPAEFCGPHAHRMLRQADLACKVQSAILDPTQAAKVKGIAPKSPFQIGGAGAVGTGTLRGIPILHQLRNAGFRIWPFDAPDLPSHPLLIEIYPRLMTGAVHKARLADRKLYLAQKRRQDPAYAALPPAVLRKAQHSEDAFDALISVLVMARERADLLTLKQTTDPTTLLEGAVWGAKL